MSLPMILVEDSSTIRDSLVAALAELADVELLATAETASQAILAAGHYSDEWALMVLDLFLKEGSGLTVLRALKERRPSQHVVVLTNYATPDSRDRCLKAGADAVFDKSTEIEAFFSYCRAL